MSSSKFLYRLQQLDSEIDASRRRIAEIDALLADDSKLKAASRAEKQAASAAAEAEKQLRKAEGAVEDQKYKLERNKEKLYGGSVTNPKELEDLQMEADSLQKYLEVLEEHQLEAMIKLDEARAEHDQKKRVMEEIRDQWERTVQELESEKKALKKSIRNLQEKRPGLAENISKDDLQLYEKIRSRAGGVAVAGMKENSCAACGSHLPSGLAQQASSPSTLAQCSTCGRILHPR